MRKFLSVLVVVVLLGQIAPVTAQEAAPTAPSNLTATVSGDNVSLNWTDNSTNETHFRLWRRASGGPSSIVSQSIGAGTTTYTDIPGGGTWEYYINACHSSAGCSSDSNTATATISSSQQQQQPTAPTAPSNPTATVSGSTVTVNWTDNSTNETYFRLWRRVPGGAWSLLSSSITTGTTTYTDTPGSGTWEYNVNACNNDGGCSSNSDSATATVAGSTSTTVPNAPSNLTATASGSSVNLNWTDNSTDETTWKVYRRPSGGTWTEVDSFASGPSSYYQSVTTGGTYEYHVNACNSAGCSADSNTVSVIVTSTSSGGSDVPAAPSGLTANVSGSNVSLSWTDNSTNETHFKLWRRTSGGSYSLVSSNISAGGTTYTDTPGSGTWEYYITACDSSSCSGTSNAVSVTVSGTQVPGTPTAPAGLRATLDSNGVSVNFNWSDASNNETGFRLYTRPSGGAVWRRVLNDDRAANTTQLGVTDYNITPGSHEYKINAVNSAGSSTDSNVISVYFAGSTFAATPANLTATLSGANVNLTWIDSATNETEYRVYQLASDDSVLAQIGFGLAPNTTSYTVAGAAGTNYKYRVNACTTTGCSLSSNHVSVPTGSGGTPTPTPGGAPTTPSGLTATKVGETVSLSWIDNSTDETGFYVYQRDLPATTWFQIGSSLSAGTTSFVDTFIYAGSFEYRVVACNSSGCSSDSNIASITIAGTQPPGSGTPAAPTGLSAALTGISITLKWTDNATNENEFKVYQRDLPGTTWFQIGTTGAGATSFVDSFVYDGNFEYRVIACNSSGCSSDSNFVKITVGGGTTPGTGAPAAPSNLTVVLESGSAQLSWKDNSTNEAEFRIYQRDSGSSWFQIGKNPASVTTFTDTFVYPGTVEYRVVACHEQYGCSADSNIATLTVSDGGTQPPTAVPVAPSNLTVVQTGNTITLTWTDNAANETEYKASQRDPPNTSWFTIGSTLPAGTTKFVDDYIYVGTFEYHVNACNSLGCSPDSNIARITVTSVGSGAGVPAAPTNLRATVFEKKVTLTWTDNATNETENRIWSRAVGGGAELAATTTPHISSFTVQAPSLGSREYYLTACNTSGCSLTSNTVVVVIGEGAPTPGAPAITSIFPSSGAVGTLVTLYGAGFATNNNTIKFDSGVILNVPSTDTKALSFRVPEDRVPLCAVTEPRCLLPAPYNPVVPGTYNVMVTNTNGTSNSVSFNVTAGTPLPGTPFVVDSAATYPKDGESDVSTTTKLHVKLNRDFDPQSTFKQFFILAPEAAPTKYIGGFFTMSQDGFDFSPGTGLEPGTAYTYRVLTSLKDRSGVVLQNEFRATFKTKSGAVIAGATVLGTVLDSADLPVKGANVYIYKEDFGTYFQATSDADGKFQLIVPAGAYKLDVSQPHGRTDLIRPAPLSLTLENNETKRLTVKFATTPKQITGLVNFSNGKAVTDAEVGAYSLSTGQWTSTKTDLSGKYTLRVGGGKWKLGIHPGGTSASWSYDGPFPEVEFLRDATDDLKTVNFTVLVSNTTLTVNTVDENKQPLKEVGVMVDTAPASDDAASSLRKAIQYKLTDAGGVAKFSLQAGTYFVRVYLPDDRGYLNPSEQSVTLKTGDTKEATLVFRRKTGATTVLLRGITKLENGGVIDGFVWAWSEGGRFTHTQAGKNGTFEMRLAAGDKWHIGAGKESDGFPYKASEVVVDTSKTPASLELVLVKISETKLAPSVEVSHAATEQVVIQTQDGAKATLPPNAAGTSGNINIKMDPVVEAPSQAAAKIFGTVYDVTVKDADGKEVNKLKDNVEIVLPYDEKELKAQGISEDDLVPSFIDEKTGAWVKIDNFTIDKEKNVVICRVDHLTRFGLTATSDTTPPTAPTNVVATIVDGKVKLTWKNPTTDFDHARVYRSDRAGELGRIVAAEVRDNKLQDAHVVPGAVYYYTVRSVDGANNESGNTNQVNITAGAATPAILADKALLADAQKLVEVFGLARNQSLETQSESKVAISARQFTVTLPATDKAVLTNFVAYGISVATQELGSGERLALVRDQFETLGRVSAVALDQLAKGEKPTERSLGKEQSQLTKVLKAFEALVGRKPNFQNPSEDLAWNTMMYRIRFPRDLNKERSGIVIFSSKFGRKPTSPLDWAAVRASGYALGN